MNNRFIELTAYPLLVSISFLLYWYLSSSGTIRRFFIDKIGQERALFWHVLYQKLTGFVILGILPGICIYYTDQASFSDYGINTMNIRTSLYWVGILGVVIFCVNFFLARRPSNLEQYPQIRKKEWSIGTLIGGGFGWLIYLLGYEFLFRGVLLFGSLKVMDSWLAISLNVLLYAIAHLPKGKLETFGSVPFGLLVCLFTVSTGNIWTAFGLHACMALSNFYFSFYYHPEMKLVVGRNRK